MRSPTGRSSETRRPLVRRRPLPPGKCGRACVPGKCGLQPPGAAPLGGSPPPASLRMLVRIRPYENRMCARHHGREHPGRPPAPGAAAGLMPRRRATCSPSTYARGRGGAHVFSRHRRSAPGGMTRCGNTQWQPTGVPESRTSAGRPEHWRACTLGCRSLQQAVRAEEPHRLPHRSLSMTDPEQPYPRRPSPLRDPPRSSDLTGLKLIMDTTHVSQGTPAVSPDFRSPSPAAPDRSRASPTTKSRRRHHPAHRPSAHTAALTLSYRGRLRSVSSGVRACTPGTEQNKTPINRFQEAEVARHRSRHCTPACDRANTLVPSIYSTTSLATLGPSRHGGRGCSATEPRWRRPLHSSLGNTEKPPSRQPMRLLQQSPGETTPKKTFKLVRRPAGQHGTRKCSPDVISSTWLPPVVCTRRSK